MILPLSLNHHSGLEKSFLLSLLPLPDQVRSAVTLGNDTRGSDADRSGLYPSTATQPWMHWLLACYGSRVEVETETLRSANLKHPLPASFQSLLTLSYTLLQLSVLQGSSLVETRQLSVLPCPVSAFPRPGIPKAPHVGCLISGLPAGPVGTWFSGCLLTPHSSQQSAEASRPQYPGASATDFPQLRLQPRSRVLRFSCTIRGPRSVWKALDALRDPGFPASASRQQRGPAGSLAGRTKGSSREVFHVWQLDGAAWQEPDQTRDRNVPLAVPRMGGTQPPSAPQEGAGATVPGSFQPASTPHLLRKGPRRVCSLEASHARGRL